MRSSSSLFPKVGAVLVVAGVTVLAVASRDESLTARSISGQSRLTSVERLTAESQVCEAPMPEEVMTFRPAPEEAIPANPVTIALAMRQDPASARQLAFAQQGGTAARGGAATDPLAAKKAAVRARKPVRKIYDRYPQFSAVAVDAERNEVVLQDENLFQTMVFDRTTNTPKAAAMSEPRRAIRGPATYLELNCAVYIDPKTGNIYSLNNDTERHMTVWDREARGNASPTWKLHTPMGAFGLAVDEETEELMITAQHESSVSWFKKTARDDEAPTGVLQGDKTLLADPHGIALDTKQNVFFVANFGSVATPRPNVVSQGGPGPFWPLGAGEMVPGSGRFLPVSITVYDKNARGNTPPIRIITGSNTQLNWPAGLFVDSERGELYVANDGGGSILVFSTSAQGNAAPIRVLKGPRTLLSYPSSVFVDLKNDEMWVANFGNHRATVYPRTAAGDTAPIREIRSAPDGTPAPTLANVRIDFDTKRQQILAPN
jgi:DNA-binding beta-propeller fold protein YncE